MLRTTSSMIPIFILCSFMLPQTMLPQTMPTGPKPRVFISDSQSWEMSGNAGGSGGSFAAHSNGGARPQTAEIIKTFGERCPDVTVNNKADKADYVVLLDHEGGNGYARRDNKVAVFNRDCDAVLSHATRALGNAVKDACEAITNDWPTRSSRATAVQEPVSSASAEGKLSAVAGSSGSISVSSTPSNADIELDGNFVGNTRSTVEVVSGDHMLTLKKNGYKSWDS